VVGDAIAELQLAWPDAELGVLGQHAVYRHRDVTPAHRYAAAVKLVAGGRLLELTARDSFDDRLAALLLDCEDEGRLPAVGSAAIRVTAAEFPKPWGFECVVVVPPKIAERFDHQSALLKRVTYWVVPAFAYEFRDGEGADGFWQQLRRRDGWAVSVVRWDRVRKTRPVWD
jgi:hypothetical protein